jgi:hypothetical protein
VLATPDPLFEFDMFGLPCSWLLVSIETRLAFRSRRGDADKAANLVDHELAVSLKQVCNSKLYVDIFGAQKLK